MAGIAQVIDNFLEYLEKQRGYSAHTVAAYRRDLAQFIVFLDTKAANSSADEALTKTVFRGFVYSISEKGAKPRTLARKVAALKSLSRYCVKTGVLAANPAKTLATPKLDKPLPSFLTRTQAARMAAPMPAGETALRNRAIVELLYGTGMRLGELYSLNADTIDRRSGLVRVMGKGSKERIVPVTPDALQLIDRYLAVRKQATAQGDPLFVNKRGERLSMRQIERIVTRELAAVSSRKKRSPHVLRHSFSTHMLDEGADIRAVKECLGHASLSSTQVYTQVSKEHLRRAYNQAHPRAGAIDPAETAGRYGKKRSARVSGAPDSAE